MSTIEERVQALEHENAARKQTEELLTITVRALVSKEVFENLQESIKQSQEQNGKLFDTLNAHNVLTNERLGDIQNQIIELDGKIVGQQTETRQQFVQLNKRLTEQSTKASELQTAQAEQITLLQKILERLPDKPQNS